MVSGSAALPVSTLERWEEITGQRLLERYGMTEIGMGLSNPLHGERVAGSVGSPLPSVQARLVGEDGDPVSDGAPGEIEVAGPGVFREYWGKPDATEAGFREGWFRTGDVAILEDGRYRILGRQSVDIIKTGGYKVSALEVESALLQHDEISECAVVGVADEEWGERVAAVIVTAAEGELTLAALREWGKTRLAVYKVPSLLRVQEGLPRNVMGKVQKPAVRALFESD
jgi:malonyl-CoA/methylmalonyl-CoA synthetase